MVSLTLNLTLNLWAGAMVFSDSLSTQTLPDIYSATGIYKVIYGDLPSARRSAHDKTPFKTPLTRFGWSGTQGREYGREHGVERLNDIDKHPTSSDGRSHSIVSTRDAMALTDIMVLRKVNLIQSALEASLFFAALTYFLNFPSHRISPILAPL